MKTLIPILLLLGGCCFTVQHEPVSTETTVFESVPQGGTLVDHSKEKLDNGWNATQCLAPVACATVERTYEWACLTWYRDGVLTEIAPHRGVDYHSGYCQPL